MSKSSNNFSDSFARRDFGKSRKGGLLRVVHSAPGTDQGEFARIFDDLARKLVRRNRRRNAKVIEGNIVKIR
ncbi:hypothetical protein CGLAMM_10410 [Acetobacteraceae bacterium EV16G]|uniref:Uncharacterized protein n=1 Tax=Sorlinia euscelidii TaxID=3081148 RepID=A0ABU7U2V1_9PROT